MGLGEKILNRAERKFGKLAFPGILRWIAGFQLLGTILAIMSPGFLEAIIFDQTKIFNGEVWRAFTWLFFPSSANLVFAIISTLFYFFINDIYEHEIGTFRLNAYVLAVLAMLIGGAFSPLSNGIFTSGLMNFTFFSSMFLGAACLAPNHTIMLMFIIPIKMKWLGWLNAAFLFGAVANNLLPVLNGILVTLGLVPFFVGFFSTVVGNFKNEAKASVRRSRFQSAAAFDVFHTCKKCGITDAADPNMEFRVSSQDGQEYCLPCRQKQS